MYDGCARAHGRRCLNSPDQRRIPNGECCRLGRERSAPGLIWLWPGNRQPTRPPLEPRRHNEISIAPCVRGSPSQRAPGPIDTFAMALQRQPVQVWLMVKRGEPQAWRQSDRPAKVTRTSMARDIARRNARPARSWLALAAGAVAAGALAVGAVAIGQIVIGRLAIGRARFKSLE